MFVLDTDHMSALEWGSGVAGQRLIARLNKLSAGEAATTIITFALSRNATVLTKNLKDFSRVPGLRIEDWTI